MAYTKSGINLNVCAYCNEAIDDFSRTVDHLYPKSRGGILSNKNKRPSCGRCNKLKADMDIVEFRRAIEGMLFLEQVEHKQKLSYLKKIRNNVDKIIEELGDEKQYFVRHNTARSRKNSKKKKK